MSGNSFDVANASETLVALQQAQLETSAQVNVLLQQFSLLAERLERLSAPPPTELSPPSTSAPEFDLPSSFKVPRPSKFSHGPKDVRAWLDSVRTYLRLLHIPLASSSAVIVATSLLEGKASKWLLSRKEVTGDDVYAGFANFHDFSSAFNAHFGEPFPEDRARAQLARLRQISSVAKYASDFYEIHLHLPSRSESDRIYDFIHGLKPHIAQAVALQRPATLDSAVELAIKADSISFNLSKPSLAVRRNPAPSSGPSPMDLGQITAKPFHRHPPAKPQPSDQPRRRTIICYNCRQPGHIASHCPNKPATPSTRQSKN